MKTFFIALVCAMLGAWVGFGLWHWFAVPADAWYRVPTMISCFMAGGFTYAFGFFVDRWTDR